MEVGWACFMLSHDAYDGALAKLASVRETVCRSEAGPSDRPPQSLMLSW